MRSPSPWPETFTALQQKVVDGADLPYNTMALAKWLEVQQYVTLSGWVYEPMPVVANIDWFQSSAGGYSTNSSRMEPTNCN